MSIVAHCVGLDPDAIGLLDAAPKSRLLPLPGPVVAEPINLAIRLGDRAEDRGQRGSRAYIRVRRSKSGACCATTIRRDRI